MRVLQEMLKTANYEQAGLQDTLVITLICCEKDEL